MFLSLVLFDLVRLIRLEWFNEIQQCNLMVLPSNIAIHSTSTSRFCPKRSLGVIWGEARVVASRRTCQSEGPTRLMDGSPASVRCEQHHKAPLVPEKAERFRMALCSNQPNIDERKLAPLVIYMKHYEEWDILHINWCRISSSNSSTTVSSSLAALPVFQASTTLLQLCQDLVKELKTAEIKTKEPQH